MYHVHLQEWGWKTWYCSDCSVSISGSGSGGPFFAESNFGTATDLEPWSPGTLQPPVGLQSWVNGRLLVDGDFTIKATSSHGDLTVSWISGSIVFSTVLSFSKSNITWNCCFNNICITLKYVFYVEKTGAWVKILDPFSAQMNWSFWMSSEVARGRSQVRQHALIPWKM